jgi:membrane-bound metal-dependent hydrolase YbcI (DUF457 family)
MIKRCPANPHAEAVEGSSRASEHTAAHRVAFRILIYYPSLLDNLTHTLFGLTLARTTLGRAGRGTTAALVLSSNAPDVDVVTTAGGALSYLRWHRGPTHGPIGLVGLGLAVAALVWLARAAGDRRRRRRPDADARNRAAVSERTSFTMLTIVSMIGVLLHVLMDLPTSYGTRPFSPFDWHWYALDWMPIVDIYLLIILVAGLRFGRRSGAARRHDAFIVLVLMAANYGLRGVAHHQALALAPRLFGPTLPQRCAVRETASLVDRWPRHNGAWTAASGQRCLVEIAATPSFLSPFRWRVLAEMSNSYEVRDLDVLDRRLRDPTADVSWRVRLRYPNQWTASVEHAAATSVGQVFLGFSRFPAARWAVDANGVTTVRWEDMRFAGTPLAGDQPVPQSSMFRALVRLAPDGRVVEQRLGR